MKRNLTLPLFSLIILVGFVACAPLKTTMPLSSQRGYTLSLEFPSKSIWLKPEIPNQRDHYTGVGVITVRVRDANGQPVKNVPIIYRVDASSAQHINLRTDNRTDQDGRAQVIIEPNYPGQFTVYVHVDDVKQAVIFNALAESFGRSVSA